MKTKKHHNNKGTRQIKRGKTARQVMYMAIKMRREGLYNGPVS